MHFTIADDATGRSISFDPACQCDFGQFCVYVVSDNQVMILNISTTYVWHQKYIILVGNANVDLFMRQIPLQCKLCGPNSGPNKCTLNMFSDISSAGS